MFGKKSHVPQKIVVFGGSFNPPHIGHLMMIGGLFDQNNKENYLVDKVIVLVSNNPWKEKDENLAPFKDRLAMAKLAFEHIPNVIVSDIEKDMVAPYGTWDVLGRLKMQYPNDIISLLIGGDNVINFEKWKNYQELAHTFPVICFDRTSNAADYEYFEYIVKKYNMFQIQQIPFNVSSTSLRIWLKTNISCLGYIPTEVLNYINRNRLYSPSN